MKHRRLSNRWIMWTVIGAVLAALMLAPAIAFGQTGPTGSAFGPVLEEEAAAAANVYWTPERKKAAIPMEINIDKSAVKTSPVSPTAPDGPPVTVAGNAPGAAVPQNAEKVGAIAPATLSVAAGYTYPFPFDRSDVQPTWLYIQYPWMTNGKIFFTQRDANNVPLYCRQG